MNYPPDPFIPLLRQLRPNAHIIAFNHSYTPHQALRDVYQASGFDPADLIFAPVYAPADRPNISGLHDAAIIFLPKSRPLIELTLAMVRGGVATRRALLFGWRK